jgi:hypothetical protein
MKSIIFLALVAGTMAAGNMKQKLAQLNAENINSGVKLGDGGNICDINFG